MPELSPRYNPQETEDKWCKLWENNNTFHAEPNPQKKSFSVVIPPPNITGVLHMGHALNNTLQDILVRFKRMQGFETLWMPGTDHAGIATQNVVEKQLSKEGKKRQEIGREEFLKRLWDWRQKYGDTIIHQLKRLGASCDWQRTRFTMDEHYSEAVKLAFIKLFEKGLIYRGQYIINWCPRCQTALSDEEAQHKEINGALYFLRYPFKDSPTAYITVATTRPETMLGDTAVAVNPKDKRYKKYIGKKIILPLVKREIAVIADSFVDSKFGTGAVKVTPAHDPNDFEMGTRHRLEFVNIMHPDAKLNENAGRFAGLDRFEGRKRVVEALKEGGLLEKIEPHAHAVGHCYRCDTVVEPYLSRQWFVKMKPLAKPAIDVVKKGKIKFTPSRWTKVYLNWMTDIRDWCISRQIWWGHRIPAWYCIGDDRCTLKCKEPIISLKPPERCPHCGSTNLRQDEDVLDTWFSSWLWPFATLYWPHKNKHIEYFYPTTALFTASEILFFWVARMIMAGLEFMDDIPFHDVYIHGTVRDAKGLKMSKSLGNAIDPLEIIREYGADALRFSLILNSGQDLFISKEKFEIGRNFANKIWNATRLILMNIPDETRSIQTEKLETKNLDLPSLWILSRLHTTIDGVTKALSRYRFSEAETLIYDFFWRNFCDWYLEIIKDKFTDKSIQTVVLYVLRETIKVLHPFMPFITEEIWQILNPAHTFLTLDRWPVAEKRFISKPTETEMQNLISFIGSVRNVRAQWNIDPQTRIDCFVQASANKDILTINKNVEIISLLAKIDKLVLQPRLHKSNETITGIAGKIKFCIPLGDIIDVKKEKERIVAQIQNHALIQQSLTARLKNKDFLKKAPKDVVIKEKTRLDEIDHKISELKKAIQDLK